MDNKATSKFHVYKHLRDPFITPPNPNILGKKLFLKPASFQSKNEQNGNTATENGVAPSPLVNNPFLKCDKDEPEVTKNDEKNSEQEKDPAANNLFKPAKPVLFGGNAGSALSENSNFVFGQNLHERVVMVSGDFCIKFRTSSNKAHFLGECKFHTS